VSTPVESAGDWVESFNGLVRATSDLARVRGLSNATLYVSPGRLRMKARAYWRRISGWDELDYGDWPAVVVETLVPFGGPGLLFERSGRLVRCSLHRYDGARLRAALDRAGFVVVEWRHRGWDALSRVPRDVIGEQAANVPPAVVAPYGRDVRPSRRSVG